MDSANTSALQTTSDPEIDFGLMALQAPLPLLLVEAEHGAIISMNRLARETLGLDPDSPHLRDIFDNPSMSRQFLLIARGNGFVRQFEARLLLAGGQRVWVILAARLVETGNGHHLVVSIVDIHERRLNEDALLESDLRHRRVLEAANEGYALFDAQTAELLEVNQALCDLLNYPEEQLLRLAPEDILSPESIAKIKEESLRWGPAPHHRFELELLPFSRPPITVEISLSAVSDQDGRVTSLFALVADITERKRNEERVLYLAFYDTLTALPNRFLFAEQLDQALRLRSRTDTSLALLFIDLDDFKCVNDSMGHDAGDDLLRIVARRLVDCVRSSDTVSRQGGDEFMVLLTHLQHPDDATQIANKMLAVLDAPITLGENKVRITASIGIALCPGAGEDATTLRRHADMAMYKAKQRGKHSFALYDANDQALISAPNE
ncbi:sensor domain-containing diguanylate cyclase [Burkholderiaceae bacterium DAT-1]|nr:sensor domain-containing diguanylate cyclase [Burkholderiaceae bacterium DAT-1]